MSIRYFCDRCKDETPHLYAPVKVFGNYSSNPGESPMLCTDCLTGLRLVVNDYLDPEMALYRQQIEEDFGDRE